MKVVQRTLNENLPLLVKVFLSLRRR